MRAYTAPAQIEQNLRDAGCGGEFIRAFMAELEGRKSEESIKMLQSQRRCLLENCHEWQKKIDCLDYLIYQIEKQG